MTWQATPSCEVPVRKTLSPQTMGEDQPWKGTGVCQATFSVADHFRGRLVSAETPWPVGPRKRGQFSAWAREGRSVRRMRIAWRMRVSPWLGKRTRWRRRGEVYNAGLTGGQLP